MRRDVKNVPELQLTVVTVMLKLLLKKIKNERRLAGQKKLRFFNKI